MTEFFTIFRTIVFVFVALMWIKMFIFLILAPFYPIKEHLRKYRALKKRNDLGLGEYKPKVSVIIPAWNEEVGVLKTVQSVLANDYENIEIVIVNDGSTDNSDEVIKNFIKKVEEKKWIPKGMIKYKYQKNGGKGVALNTGIELSSGEIILTMDADSAVTPDALTNLVEYYLDDKVMAAVGNVKVSNNSTMIGLTQQLEYFFGFYFKRAHGVMGAEYIFGGACASFRRVVFEKLGLFDTKNKTEDIEMSMRVRFEGMECAYMENVVAYTEGASNLIGLVNQRLRWKKGRFDTFKQYRQLFFSTDEKHNYWLSFFILPYAMLSELQLFFEPLAISILIMYSVISADYLSLALGLAFTFQIYYITALFSSERVQFKTILSFPFTWTLFYFLVWVEFMALIKSVVMYSKGEQVEWQRWERKGVGKEIGT